MKELKINIDDLIKKKIEKEFNLDFDILVIEGFNSFHFSTLIDTSNGFIWVDIKEQRQDSFIDNVFDTKYEALKYVIIKEIKVYGFKEQRDFIDWMHKQELCFADEK